MVFCRNAAGTPSLAALCASHAKASKRARRYTFPALPAFAAGGGAVPPLSWLGACRDARLPGVDRLDSVYGGRWLALWQWTGHLSFLLPGRAPALTLRRRRWFRR